MSPELIRVEPGAAPTTKWQQPFDASLTDVFQVQADIATKVASALNVALGDSVRHELAARPTENLAAYDAYLKGEAASQGMAAADPASLRRAIGFYQQAVALDPGSSRPGPSSPARRSLLYTNSTPTPELAAQAREAADRAQALGPDRPEGQVALGDYYRYVTVDNRQAPRGLRGRAQAGAHRRRLARGGGADRTGPGPLGGGAPAPHTGGRARSPLGQHGAAHRAARCSGCGATPRHRRPWTAASHSPPPTSTSSR